MSQKINVQVVKEEKAALSSWNIFDENFELVFSGNDYVYSDSVTCTLEEGMRYILQISIYEIYNHDYNLYTLSLNNEAIILIKPEIGTGDHFFPFFTGIRQEEVKITGGTNADIADFPWQVYFKSASYFCGGSIIDENWILTAAHCTINDAGEPIPPDEMSIVVGATNPFNEQEGKIYNIREVIINGNFNSNTFYSDIALLKTELPINYANASPVKLITSTDVANGAIDPGVMSWVTGWGLINVKPDVFPDILQKVQLPLVTNEQASVVWNNISPSHMMAGFLNGNKDACNGDSGGPLVVPVFDEYKLAGIVSWGSSDCDTYGAYTRVSDFETWIREQTGIAKEYWPPAPVGNTLVCQGEESGQYSVSNIAGTTAYEWRILPAEAGVVSWNSQDATLFWNTSYTGHAKIIVRTTIDNVVSEWSDLDLQVVKNTNLLSQSRDTVICEGTSVGLDVVAEGNNLTYKWYKNEELIQSGSTALLFINESNTDDSGDYFCEISGSCGNIYSDIMNLTVHPLTEINGVSPDIGIPFGGDGTIEVFADGHNLSYQWQKDDVLISGSNNPDLELTNLNASDIGLYWTTVTGTCGTRESDSIYVYIKKSDYAGDPEVFLWPSHTSDKFNVALSNDEVYTILIYNTMGKVIKEKRKCRYQTTIDIRTLPKGLYIVSLFNNNFRKSLKLVKE